MKARSTDKNESIRKELSRNQGVRQYLDFTSAADCNSVEDLLLSMKLISEHPDVIDLFSVYARLSSLNFNQELADCIAQFEGLGVKEIVLFYDAAEVDIENAAYYYKKIREYHEFLKEHKIGINLCVVPININKLYDQKTPIEVDSVKYKVHQLNDKNYKLSVFSYSVEGLGSGSVEFKSLNDADAIKIMMNNYIDKRNQAIREDPFKIEKPEYITTTMDNKPERNKTSTDKISAEIDSEFNIATDLDVEIDIAIVACQPFRGHTF